MRWVDRAVTKPNRCAVIPSIGIDHPLGYIDTQSEMPGLGDQWDNHIYVSVIAVQEMAKLIGWADPAPLLEQIAELKSQLTETENRLTEAEAVLDSIDVLEGADFRARRKTGRPTKKKVEEVVA